MSMGKIHIFTDADLDGAGCIFLLKKIYKNFTYQVTTEKKFREDFLNWQLKNKISEFHKVIICDLNLKDNIDMVDRVGIEIYDHHSEHIQKKEQYNKAITYLEEDGSCTMTVYKEHEPELTNYQKLLVKLINDYDSYTLEYPYSKPLDKVFWSYTGNRVEKFLNDFGEGFKGFNQYHKNMLSSLERKTNEFIETETFYKGTLKVSGNDRSIISCFIKFNPNEISEILLKKYKCDIALLINLKGKSVYFRKAKNCDVNMAKLAEKICDGGGHDDAAGGTLNDTIINITKLLKPIS